MRIIIALLLAVSSFMLTSCGEEPECSPAEKAEVGYGSERGDIVVKAFLEFTDENNVLRSMEIKAPFRMNTSMGRCYTGVTTKHMKLPPDYYIFECLDITDPDELGEIRVKTGIVAELITPTVDGPTQPEVDLEHESEGAVICFYRP